MGTDIDTMGVKICERVAGRMFVKWEVLFIVDGGICDLYH